jgi:hypothetical protein
VNGCAPWQTVMLVCSFLHPRKAPRSRWTSRRNNPPSQRDTKRGKEHDEGCVSTHKFYSQLIEAVDNDRTHSLLVLTPSKNKRVGKEVWQGRCQHLVIIGGFGRRSFERRSNRRSSVGGAAQVANLSHARAAQFPNLSHARTTCLIAMSRRFRGGMYDIALTTSYCNTFWLISVHRMQVVIPAMTKKVTIGTFQSIDELEVSIFARCLL